MEKVIKTGVVQKCTSCSDDMVFDIETKNLRCVSCDSTKTIRNQKVGKYFGEKPINQATDSPVLEKSTIIKCDACGGETVLNGYETTTDCEYCGSSHTVVQSDEGIMKPESMLLFEITEQEAGEKYKKWIKGKWMAPFRMSKRARSGKLKGFYSPFWDYDFRTSTEYTGKRGDYYYEKDKDGKNVRKTRWTNVSGRVRRTFDDIVVSGSLKHMKILDPKLSKRRKTRMKKSSGLSVFGLELSSNISSARRGDNDFTNSYKLDDLVKYNPENIAGFHSERYSIDVFDGLETAKDIANGVIEIDVLKDIGGDVQNIKRMNTDYSGENFRHSLLPIWISSYSYHKRVYEFAVNGQSGVVTGRYPISKLKVMILILILVGVFVYITL